MFWISALFLLSSAGCATQQSVDDLNARVTKLEKNRAEDKNALNSAIDAAESHRTQCRLDAQQRFNDWLNNNGTPIKGKSGVYSASAQGIKEAKQQESRDDEDCQKEYVDAIQVAKVKYSE